MKPLVLVRGAELPVDPSTKVSGQVTAGNTITGTISTDTETMATFEIFRTL